MGLVEWDDSISQSFNQIEVTSEEEEPTNQDAGLVFGTGKRFTLSEIESMAQMKRSVLDIENEFAETPKAHL